MTEKEIQLLGFERHDDEDFYYYTYTVATGIDFISCSSDETESGEWYVEFFDTEPAIRFYDFAKMQMLLNLLERHKV